MGKTIILFFAAVLVHAGCAPTRQPIGSRLSNVDADTGNLIAFWLEYPDRPEYYPQKERPVLVTEPYAVFMVWLGEERRFHIYDNVTKQTFSTSDFEAFLEKLGSLPREIAIQRFDACCGSRTYDMPAQARERVSKIMQSGNRKWAISAVRGSDREIVCICESTGFRYPQ